MISWGVGDAADPDGSLIVATDAALYEQRSLQRIEWQRVTKGTWEQPEFVIDFDDDVFNSNIVHLDDEHRHSHV